MEKIAFIGAGNMASALIGGLREAGALPTDLLAIDPSAEQRALARETHGVRTEAAPGEFLSGYDVVVWAVKPQVLKGIALAVAGSTTHALHVSIAAGIRAESLEAWLGSGRVVRAMPNTPALVGAGVCGLYAGSAVTEADRRKAEALLAATGKWFWVNSDEMMNAVTAITGSGPAYVFHFLEGLARSAVALGFEPAQAKEIASAMVLGAVRQSMKEATSFELLRQRVTSKGGTTEAALALLDAGKTQDAMLAATRAAYERARVLGEELAR